MSFFPIQRIFVRVLPCRKTTLSFVHFPLQQIWKIFYFPAEIPDSNIILCLSRLSFGLHSRRVHPKLIKRRRWLIRNNLVQQHSPYWPPNSYFPAFFSSTCSEIQSLLALDTLTFFEIGDFSQPFCCIISSKSDSTLGPRLLFNLSSENPAARQQERICLEVRRQISTVIPAWMGQKNCVAPWPRYTCARYTS